MVDDELSLEKNPFENVTLYPNPIKNQLILSNSRNLFIETVALYDLSGRAVKRITVNNNLAQLDFNLSELSSGIYMMILNSKFGPFEKRIMKE